ncbi:hypothetical protein MPSEU_000542600 [Mayamaea pseudoterrestris]|nr:hypothetical protein MPSEU_000542600 [Mayamaea pseudoterrestris]
MNSRNEASSGKLADDDDYDEDEISQALLLHDTSSLPINRRRSNESRRLSREEESFRADRLSIRLLEIDDDDEQEHNRVLRESLQLSNEDLHDAKQNVATAAAAMVRRSSVNLSGMTRSGSSARRLSRASLLTDMDVDELYDKDPETTVRHRMWTMICFAVVGLFVLVGAGYTVSVRVVGPPNQPVGAYQLVELQEGSHFFDFYTFYAGKDSAGSAGYNTYVSMERAQALGLVNVTMEADELDSPELSRQTGRRQDDIGRHRRTTEKSTRETTNNPKQRSQNETVPDFEPFIYIKSAPTADGPRESIRLEGIRRFNRGLFIIDVRHVPAGCGVWAAGWMTDETNWPVNGEIDVIEGINYQSHAKTALHSTTGCTMENDVPYGVMTGNWDTAQGIPDAKTGVPDMTMRYAKNCFVYDQHQWLNQGCVAVSERNDTLGAPLNDNGGGVFVLEWDPMNRHIRSWAFTPHDNVPDNIVQSIRTAHLTDSKLRVVPNPELWPLPYAYFAVGEGTSCPASHFRNMRLVFNTAFCGSVAGNRFQMDCPAQAKQFQTCNDYLKSDPDEMDEAFWKIRGVYVYERQWERVWLH